MRLVALLVPVALVGALLGARSLSHDHEVTRIVREAPVPTAVAVREASRIELRAPRARRSTQVQEQSASAVTIDFHGDLEGTIATTIEMALEAAAAGLEAADLSTEMSFEITEDLLEAIGELLGEVSVTIDGELELVTKHGARIQISGDGGDRVTVIDISN